ncbi:conjugal transfer protein TraF [Vibrio sp. TH_r3]|uniref:conjugal transfer protein TraF n=1 Tax=Vibrio sp. TH_r3 TaxID=3082084 RepID=UPI00295517D4|nr:conjugal transfer protein TraF [Vibrio sp. TH_r3]MDV7103512.1 conjugal transfer protein TraF [Vibrio sp. TH_r3]
MNKLKLTTVIVITIASSPTLAASYAVDARGDAMGGVGVVSATYLTAPFYNPALAAIYRRNDDVGMLLPGVGISYSDENMLADNIDTMVDFIDSIDLSDSSSYTPQDIDDLDTVMNDMQGDNAKLEFGAVAAFGIPNPYLSTTIFGKAYAETFVAPDIANKDSSLTGNAATVDQAERSRINMVSVGILEAGASFARYQTVFGQHMSFGLSPKIQRINTYAYSASVEDYDLLDAFENSTSKSIFNLDLGAMWFYGPFRVGVSGVNLISRDVETQLISTTSGSSAYTYQLRPQYTVGAGFVADYFSLSVDYDVNEDKRFDQFEDNTQWIRVGMEIDVLRQLQLRGGYKKNLAYNNSEGTVTGGIGLSPLGLFELDLAISYTNENSVGAYANFLATY